MVAANRGNGQTAEPDQWIPSQEAFDALAELLISLAAKRKEQESSGAVTFQNGLTSSGKPEQNVSSQKL